MTDADVDAYHALFPRKDGQLAGEFSNRYSYDVWTLPLIKRAAPDAKLLMTDRLIAATAPLDAEGAEELEEEPAGEAEAEELN